MRSANLLVALAVVAGLMLCGAVAVGETVLIDGTAPDYTKDGSFELEDSWNGSGSALAANLNITLPIIYRSTATPSDGAKYTVLGTGYGVYVDTGYDLVLGDTFNLSFYHGKHVTAANFSYKLFTTTTDDDTGTVEDVIASGTVTAHNSYTLKPESFVGIGNVTADSAGERLFLAFTGGNYNALDQVDLSTGIDPVVLINGLTLATVASNVPPGTLVGTLSTVGGDVDSYLLVEVNDYTYFDIANATTNLRTAKWIDKGSFDITIMGTNSTSGFWVTNDFTITAEPGDPIFIAGADVQIDAPNGTVVGTARAGTSGAGFSIVADRGRDDLFYMDGADLKVANSASWGGLNTTNYVMLQALLGGRTSELIVEAVVVSSAANGTLFMLR